jgi:hypothetical protein
MTCEELLIALNEYVDDEASLAVCEEFAEHLAGCNPCQVVVDNIRQSIALYKAGQPYPMPAGFEARLKESLLKRWQRKFNDAG